MDRDYPDSGFHHDTYDYATRSTRSVDTNFLCPEVAARSSEEMSPFNLNEFLHTNSRTCLVDEFVFTYLWLTDHSAGCSTLCLEHIAGPATS
jgi:hypothetical protein